MQYIESIRAEAHISEHLWVKVLGMLNQNWCILEKGSQGQIELIFFNDHGAVFDWLQMPDLQAAHAALILNRFFWMWETPSLYSASGVPKLPEPGTRNRNRPIYSSGEYWSHSDTSEQATTGPEIFHTTRSSDDLQRFIDAQDRCWYTLVEEIAAGRKETHWMWFTFPQLRGLGSSRLSQYYGLSGKAEAKDYWSDDVLESRMRSCLDILLDLPCEIQAEDIFGKVDALKFHSCLTLFEYASSGSSDVTQVLLRYFGEERCIKTLNLINS